MSSPRTESTDRPDDPAEKPRKSQLSAVQIAAGALASVSAAVVASFFGVAGTLIGAALASVISTVSAALYTNSLSRTNEQLRRVRSQLVPVVPRSGTAERSGAAPPPAAGTRVLPAALDPRRAPSARRRPRWPRVAGYAVAVFGLAMAIVTGIEIIGQQPVSALVGAEETSGTTTLGSLTDASTSRSSTPTTPPSTPAPSTPSTPSTAPGSETPTESPATSTGSSTSASPSGTAGRTASSSAAPTGSSGDAPTSESAPDATGGAAPTP
jgi:hypothetical protein